MFCLEHAITDGSILPSGERRTISRRLLYIEIDRNLNVRHSRYAPYLDYRPLRPDEPQPEQILAHSACAWINRDLEALAQRHAVGGLVREHLAEVKESRLEMIRKTREAVKERLTREIAYWDHRAQELRLQEAAGRPNAKLNSQEAARRADELQIRLQRRMEELDQEGRISALPPVVVGGVIVIPAGFLAQLAGQPAAELPVARDTQAVAARAREIILEVERRLGYQPVDVECERLGYDIESRDPATGRLRFIEVKGRDGDASTVTVTRNEILTSLNKPDSYILAIVEFLTDGSHRVHYIRKPFHREPDFGVTSVNYNLAELLARAEQPT
jgi:hypothetical protein